MTLCALEVVLSAGFTALYLWLMSSQAEAYFWFFGLSLLYLFVLMLIPYTIIGFYFVMKEKDNQIMNRSRDASKEKIRFIDERDNLKLVVAGDAVLYIQSEENYLKICYLEQNEVRFCTIRSSMKRIEDLCARNGLVRCHRSYFVNKIHVQALQKDKEFTYAVRKPHALDVSVGNEYFVDADAEFYLSAHPGGAFRHFKRHLVRELLRHVGAVAQIIRH